jgi:hypothetical protein
MSKTFRLAAADIKPIAEGYGMGIATDRITVDGEPVGHMYRETSAFENDSGWRFTAGTETEAYGNDPDNWEIQDINVLANCDAAIVPFLDAPVGSQFARFPLDSPLAPVPTLVDPTPQHQALGTDWWIELPGRFAAQVTDGGIQLASIGGPSRVIWADIWKPPAGDSAGAQQLASDIRAAVRPSGAQEFDEPGADEREIRIGYWCEEAADDGTKHWTLYAYTIRDTSFVQAAFISPLPDPDWALAAWRSMRYAPAPAGRAPAG